MSKGFAYHEITVYNIYHAIKKLANKNSSGEDGISARCELKQYWEEVCIPLTLIFNFSLIQNQYPNSLAKSMLRPAPS